MTTNLYSWASENLSEQRARAFKNALREIDNDKFSDEWREAQRELGAIVSAHEVAVKNDVATVQTQAQAQLDTILAQIAELQAKADAIRSERDDKVMRIRCAVYKSAEYAAQEEITSALWRRDDEAVEPKRQALVAKYSAAQAKVGA